MPEMTVSENIYFGRFSRYKAFPVINWKEIDRKTAEILLELVPTLIRQRKYQNCPLLKDSWWRYQSPLQGSKHIDHGRTHRKPYF